MKNKSIVFFEFIIFSFLLFYKFFILDKFLDYYLTVGAISWVLLLVLASKLIGYRKDNNICKTNAIQITIIGLLMFILFTYLSGLFFGFNRSAYAFGPNLLISTVIPVGVGIVCQEYIRWMIAFKSRLDRLPIIIITILFTLFDVIISYNSSISSNEQIFIFISTLCVASAARNAFASYVCYRVSYVPGLILRLFMGLYIYLLPIFPDYGNYVSSVLGIIIPYIIYMFISKMVQRAEKDRPSPIKKGMWYINIPLIVGIFFIVSLVGGLFKYQIIAIGSGSMEPVIYRGDAVIFEKNVDPKLLSEGEVIMFKSDGKIIAHRIIEIIHVDDKYSFKTKGDNNNNEDDTLVTEEDLVGSVKLNIKYIGYPSLWFQEILG